MSQAESIIAEICENVWDTVDYLDVQHIIKAGAGKKMIALEYEADGPDRAKLIEARMIDDLNKRLHGLLHVHRFLMQVSTSAAKPFLMKELVAITGVAIDNCKPPGRWLNAPEHKDETLGSRLRLLLVLWMVAQDQPN